MHQRLKRLFAIYVLVAMTMSVCAQDKEIEEDPLTALRWFHSMRTDQDGVYSEGRRWDAYLEMRRNTLEKSPAMPAANWHSLGPNTLDSLAGRMISHAFDPQDPDIIWAGAANGGLWKSSDAGESWQPVANDLPTLEISEVTINPNNRDEMIIGTGADRFPSTTLRPGIGVLKSTDRGLTWQLTGFSYNVVDAISVSRIIWHPTEENILFMAASNGFWTSSDGGENWALKRGGRVADIDINPQSPDILYGAFRQDGIYRSIDGGESWSLLNNGLPSGTVVGLSCMTLCESQPQILYTSITNNTSFALEGFYKTMDGGDSWVELNNAPNVSCSPNGSSCIGWYVNQCGVSPVDPDLVILGGMQLWRSDDGGNSWSWHDYLSNGTGYDNSGLAYVDQWDIGFHPQNPETIYLFNDGGVQKSVNGGLRWNKKSNNLVTAHIYRIASALSDTTTLIGGFQDHGLVKLDNSGGNANWQRWSVNDGTAVIVDPNNSQIFYGSFFFGVHYKNPAGGENWLSTTIPIQNGILEGGQQFAPLVMDMQNTQTLYTASTAKIYKTVNGGSLWNSVASIPNVYTIAVDRVNSDVVYAHSYTGSSWTVWRSDDAGSTWAGINHSSIPSWRVVDLQADPVTEGVIYAVRNSAFPNSDHVKRSTDYGETWTNITGNLPDITCSAIAISPYTPDHLYLATDLGVFASSDGGIEWSEFNDGLPLTYVSDIHYHPQDRSLRISTIGRGAYKSKAIDAHTTAIEDGAAALPLDFQVHGNYPNPFNPSTRIDFAITRPGHISVAIYNELGQRIRKLIDQRFTPGSHNLIWDGKNDLGQQMSTGIYYARFIHNHTATAIKMTLVK